jgi:hypothetical protein
MELKLTWGPPKSLEERERDATRELEAAWANVAAVRKDKEKQLKNDLFKDKPLAK